VEAFTKKGADIGDNLNIACIIFICGPWGQMSSKGRSIVRISRRSERGLKLVELFIEGQTLTKIKG
jgi:hypothetical protein